MHQKTIESIEPKKQSLLADFSHVHLARLLTYTASHVSESRNCLHHFDIFFLGNYCRCLSFRGVDQRIRKGCAAHCTCTHTPIHPPIFSSLPEKWKFNPPQGVMILDLHRNLALFTLLTLFTLALSALAQSALSALSTIQEQVVQDPSDP